MKFNFNASQTLALVGPSSAEKQKQTTKRVTEYLGFFFLAIYTWKMPDILGTA